MMEKVINVEYYDVKNSWLKPHKDAKEKVIIYTCNNSKNCQAYTNNTCIMLNGLYGHKCKYGKEHAVEGYPRKSKNCGKLIQEYKTKYKKESRVLKGVHQLERCGDYIFLNLPFLNNEDIWRDPNTTDYEYTKTIGPEIKEKIKFGDLIHTKHFTPEFICRLIDFRPQSNGFTLKDYYEWYIPHFCYELQSYFRDIYEETKKIKPEIENLVKKVLVVHKYAKIKTLNPGKVKMGSSKVYWDGEKIITDSDILSIQSSWYDGMQVMIIPTDNTIVEVIDENTVTNETEFV